MKILKKDKVIASQNRSSELHIIAKDLSGNMCPYFNILYTQAPRK